MIKGGKGGSSTKTGIYFEEKTSIKETITKLPNYEVICKENRELIYYNGEEIAEFLGKHKLYKNLLEPNGINWRNIISKQLLPDEAIYVFHTDTIHIIEKKYQEVAGSVDEKLETCVFKKQQYTKLLRPLDIRLEYSYLLNDFFKNDKYADVLNFIESQGCQYFFYEVPADFLGLPLLEK